MDQAGFALGIRALIRVTGRSAADLIRQQARLFVTDVLRLTPPRHRHPLHENFAYQRRVGQAAVGRDIRKVFVSVENLGVVKQPQNQKLGDRLRKLSRAGNIAGVTAILRNIGIANPKVLASAQASVHKAARDRRGRVGKGNGHFVLSEASIKRHIKVAQSHVGRWKAGWMNSARHLAVKVPRWISEHSQPGVFVDTTNHRTQPGMLMGNSVPRAEIGGDLNIIETALRIRERNMKRMAERIISSGWKKAKFIG